MATAAPESSDQGSEVMIHEGYMSLIDLDCSANFGIAEFADHPQFAEMEALYAEVKGWVDIDVELANA